jgi:hypothetical protein
MSLTITPPTTIITNKPIYTVDTSLIEDASHKNIRIRASIRIDAETVAIVEQPKGLTNFDFTKILDSFAGKLLYDHKSSSKIITPAVEVITAAWTNVDFTIFASANKNNFYGQIPSSGAAWVRSNSFALNKGDIVCFSTNTTTGFDGSPGTGYIRLTTSTTKDAGVIYQKALTSSTVHSTTFFIEAEATYANAYIWFGGESDGSYSIIGKVSCVKIPTGETAQYGRPCVYYRPVFQTYYEDASNVTQAPSGELSYQDVFLYVPVKSANNISNYILGASNKRFLSKSAYVNDFLNESPIVTFPSSRYHNRVLGVTNLSYGNTLFYTKAPSMTQLTVDFLHGGWFFVNLENESFGELTDYTEFWLVYDYLFDNTDMSYYHRLNVEQKCYPDPIILDFQGRFGNESVVLSGFKKNKILADKDFFYNEFGMSVPIYAKYLKQIVAGTLPQSEDFFELIGELISSEKTVLMQTDEPNNYDHDNCVPVVIGNRNITTIDGIGMMENEIEITYWPYDE